MKVSVLSKSSEVGKKDLPKQFSESVHPDLIKRAVITIQSHKRQPYGASPEAGKRASAELSRRRRKYRGSYGMGISRVPRKIMSRAGTRFNWVGAFAPGTVGGRRAHPPKAEKIFSVKMNTKENRKAIRSALSATLDKEYVNKKHIVPDNYPVIIESNSEEIKTTKDALSLKKKIQKRKLQKNLKQKSRKKLLKKR